MKLIIDCGSTKADWLIIKDSEVLKMFSTEGFNPNYTDKKTMLSIILNNSLYNDYIQYITDVFFYGSGCGNEKNCIIIEEIFSSIFPDAKINVTHDMMAACHALLGNEKGIACILGTGSNSCYYDGKNITSNAVSLGFILGDEGSGAHLGKALLHDYFYGIMPEDLHRKFENAYNININSLIDNVYHNNQVSRYLASFTKFLHENIENEYVNDLCSRCFDEFIEFFIMKYEMAKHTEIGFVGSIAFYFQDIIRERLEAQGLKLGKFLKNPIEGLIAFHS